MLQKSQPFFSGSVPFSISSIWLVQLLSRTYLQEGCLLDLFLLAQNFLSRISQYPKLILVGVGGNEDLFPALCPSMDVGSVFP